MADDAAAADARKRRTFRKYSYRGIEVCFRILLLFSFTTLLKHAHTQLDNLLDLSTDQLIDVIHARARRRFQRGLKRKPMALIKKLRKAKKEAEPGEKPRVVKTHLRDMIIVPEMIGSVRFTEFACESRQ
jgi:hypothetical protein